MSQFGRVVVACLVATVLLCGDVQAVRQCSCQETKQCLTDMKAIGEGCVDECWSHTSQVTQNPRQLRECFRGQNDEIEGFIDCFQDQMQGCAPDRNGPTIPAQSLDALMKVAEHKIRLTIKKTLESGLAGDMHRVVAATEAFGMCAKQCIVRQTSGGVCLQKYNCQPLLPNEAKAKKLFNHCSKLDFKTQAGSLCNCALNAGVTDLATYCPVLALMGPQH